MATAPNLTLKYFNGTEYVDKPLKVFNGATFTNVTEDKFKQWNGSEFVRVKTSSVAPEPNGDDYWNLVNFLVSATEEGTFVDLGKQNKTITKTNTVTVDTGDLVDGEPAIVFSGGTGNYLTIPTLNNYPNLGKGVWTYEFFTKLTALPVDGSAGFLLAGLTSSNDNRLQIEHQLSTGKIGIYTQVGTGTGVNAGYQDITLGDLHHVVLQRRADDTFQFAIDGDLKTPFTAGNLTNVSSFNGIFLGINRNGGVNRTINGKIWLPRLTMGVNRYSASFTPPTSYHKNANTASDVFYNDTTLIINVGDVGSPIVDSSPLGKTPSVMNGVVIEDGWLKPTILIPKLTYESVPDFTSESEEWTLEFFLLYAGSSGANQYFMSTSNTRCFNINSSNVLTAPGWVASNGFGNLTAGTEYHIAICKTKTGEVFRLKNGSLYGAVSSTSAFTGDGLEIFSMFNGSSNGTNSKIRGVRVSKKARYIGDYEIPQYPYVTE